MQKWLLSTHSVSVAGRSIVASLPETKLSSPMREIFRKARREAEEASPPGGIAISLKLSRSESMNGRAANGKHFVARSPRLPEEHNITTATAEYVFSNLHTDHVTLPYLPAALDSLSTHILLYITKYLSFYIIYKVYMHILNTVTSGESFWLMSKQ